ncbi:MAG: hypothetical protein AB7O67_20770 [Vicinamibacterales bacterium]
MFGAVSFVRDRIPRALFALVALFPVAACGPVLGPKYEYEEDIYLTLDGSATVYVNASVPALVALRGAPFDVDPRARLDRDEVRAFFGAATFGAPDWDVANVSLSRRDGRRYVHVRLDVPDVAALSRARAFDWSEYRLERTDEQFVYRQLIGNPAGRDVGDVGWTGNEQVAVRLHLPSRVTFHNLPDGEVERGNIISWEQPLAARIAGEPLVVEARMETESILVRTLLLFGLMILLALVTLAGLIWMVMRRGAGADEREDARPPRSV